MLNAHLVFEIFTFLFSIHCYVEKWLDKKVEVSFKTYKVTDWTINNFNTHIDRHLEKYR